MPDSTTIRRPEDPKRVNINQSWEVAYWCETLGCTKAELIEAVKNVGPMVEKVKKWLKNH